MENPYKECPVYETKQFLVRLVRREDAGDLLKCYSDPKAQPLFNADHCTSDFCLQTADEMRQMIEDWLKAYEKQEYVRFAVVDQIHGKAVGTIEAFGMVGVYRSPFCVLRLDLCSDYERPDALEELLTLCVRRFFPLFGVDQIRHKAVPAAVNRLRVLKKFGFTPFDAPGSAHSWVLEKQAVRDPLTL